MVWCVVDEFAFVQIQKAKLVKPPAEGEEASSTPTHTQKAA